MDESKSISSFAHKTILLSESISTTIFLLRQLHSREITVNESFPIFEALRKQMQSTLKELKQSINDVDDGESQVQGRIFLDQVSVVVGNIRQFVSILNKFPKGNPELDKYTAKILDEFTQLSIGFAAIANFSINKNVDRKKHWKVNFKILLAKFFFYNYKPWCALNNFFIIYIYSIVSAEHCYLFCSSIFRRGQFNRQFTRVKI